MGMSTQELKEEAVRYAVPYIAPVAVGFTVAPLTRRYSAPLHKFVSPSSTLYRICGDGKRHKHTVDPHRVEQRT